MNTAVIVDAVRTPLGKRNGRLKNWHPVDLAAEMLSALTTRNDIDPAMIDAVVMPSAKSWAKTAIRIATPIEVET